MIKRIAILGATGSIGTSTLDVIRERPDDYRVTGLAAGRNMELLARQIREFQPPVVSVQDEAARDELTGRLRESRQGVQGLEILTGPEGAATVAASAEADLVVSAMVGIAGLIPTYRALQAGRTVALANKETLVAAGRLMMEAARKNRVRLLPVDSEHNAIFQCLNGENPKAIQHLWLTASGGPFFRTPLEEFPRITPAAALRHPTWNMGPKITIDSATMMNKGLEIIEAHWLFQVPPAAIRVAIHPQSVVHSMVEFIDGSIIAQLGRTDMRLPIRFALRYPEREEAPRARLDLFSLRPLEFFNPDCQRFPCLDLACQALQAGGMHPAVLSAANEIAVEAFLAGRIPFTGIPHLIRQVLERAPRGDAGNLEQLLDVDRNTRAEARHIIESGKVYQGV